MADVHPLPGLDIGGGVSGDVYQGAPVSSTPGLGELKQTLDGFSNQLGQMATKAVTAEGQDKAAADAQAGTITPQSNLTTYGEAYNGVAKQSLSVARRAAMSQQMGAVYAQNPDDPAKLAMGFAAIQKGFQPTGFPEVDAVLNGDFATLSADYANRASQGAQDQVRQADAANFASAVQIGGAHLDQAANGAPFSPQGAATVTGAVNTFVAGLIPFGPPQAFTIGDIQVPADPTRTGRVSAAQIAASGMSAVSQAKKNWIVAQQAAAGSGKDQKDFADKIDDSWAKADPVLAGLSASDYESLSQELEDRARRATNDDKTTLAASATSARNMLQAWQWGGDVDAKAMMTAAQASGDPGLVAEASFYASMPQETRGVLKTVVARQLGIGGQGEGGPGVQWVSPTGQPLNPTSGARGMRNNNPGNLTALPPGQQWAGQTGLDPQGYVQFDSLQSGMAAADKNLLAKQTRHGLNTLSTIIGDPTYGWANAKAGNNPAAYAAAVSRATGIGVDQPIDLTDQPTRAKVLQAMYRVENGPGAVWAPPAGAQPGTPTFAAWANTKEGFSTDPIKFLLGSKMTNGPVATVAPLVPQGAFSSDPAVVQGWAKALQQRQAVGVSAAQTYGVPVRMLTNAERDAYKDELANNPGAAVGLAMAAQSALGTAGAHTFLSEVGQGAPEADTAMRIGALSLTNPSFARQAVQGLAAKGAGAQPSPFPEEMQSGKPAAPGTAFNALQAAVAPAFRFVPDRLASVRSVAEAVHLTDSQKGLGGTPWSYINGAVGGVHDSAGRWYGGITAVNGQPAVLPSWIAQDRVTDALGAVGAEMSKHPAGPVYSNGAPVGAKLASMQMYVMPSGRYRFVDPGSGRPINSAPGHPFELDFDRNRGFIQSRLPDAIRR